jgi:hypothetical protein
MIALPVIVSSAPAPENSEGEIEFGNNFSWGVGNATILDFILTAENKVENLSYYINEPIFIDVYWAVNGSGFALGDFFRLGNVVHSVYNPAVPIGNWTYLTITTQSSLIIDFYPNSSLEFIENANEWGYRYSYNYYGFIINSETIWFKSDGSLESVHFTVDFEDEEIYTVTLARVTGIDPIILISIIGVSVFGVATIILAIQYIRERE